VNFSPAWDAAYREGRHWSVWPWSDVVSLTLRHARPEQGFRRVLEIGCGAGANISFFDRLGVDYAAVDGSDFAVAALNAAYPHLLGKIAVADFTKGIPFAGPFDLVVDRAALTQHHRRHPAWPALIHDVLRPGGKLIGINWFSRFSASHNDASAGDGIDEHTRTNIAAGPFAGIGAVHFSDHDHIVDLIETAGLRVERLDHHETAGVIPADSGRLGWWNFVAVKP
jgi:SAM-dependent methyltransferase